MNPVSGSSQMNPVSGSSQMNPVSGSSQMNPVSGSSQMNPVPGSSQISFAQINPLPAQTNSSLATSFPVKSLPLSPQTLSLASQPSNVLEKNTVTSLKLNLSNLAQKLEKHKHLLRLSLSRLHNDMKISNDTIIIPKSALQSDSSNIPQGEPGKVTGDSSGALNSMEHMNALIPNALDKLDTMNSGSNTCPGISTSKPSTSGISQDFDDPGVANTNCSDTIRQNDGMPPVSIGTCLLCGRDCDGCQDLGNESEDIKPFLPPPPTSHVEVDSLFAKLKEQDKESPAEPASVINTKMFLHQKQALNWMINKENSNELGPFWRENREGEWLNEGTKLFTSERPTCIKGGILADDMGLGKTLTVIALIFTNHLNGKPMFLKKETTSTKKRKASTTDTGNADTSEPQVKKPSLESSFHEEEEVVVVKKESKRKEKKALAIRKRKEEIMNQNRMLGNKKKKDPGALFRQIFLPKILKKKEKQDTKIKKEEVASPKVQKPKPIDVDAVQPSTSNASIDVSLIDDDDDDDDDDSDDDVTQTDATTNSVPRRTTKLLTANPVPVGAAKATLIICPLSVLSNWTDQICTHVNPNVKLRVYMYYGAQRIRDLKYLSNQDIVLTTYPTLSNDFRTKFSPLYKIKWLRIILDEGHMIRNKSTTLSKAALKLEAERRWVVTGTPIQNRIDDLRTLLMYLKLEPFNDNQWWKTSIANLQKVNNDLADFRLNTLIKHVSIRRLKDDKIDNSKLVELPPKQVVIQDIEMSEEERKVYDMMQGNGQAIIRGYIRRNSVLKHYGHCFAILMRLRQLCLHPRLCRKAIKEVQQALDTAKDVDDAAYDNDNDDSRAALIKVLMEVISSGDSEECSICLESLNEPVITSCTHVFCCACITDALNTDGLEQKCPMCRAPVNEIDLLHVPEEERNKNNEKTAIDVDEDDKLEDSAKIKALISSLEAIRDKDPSIKSVVVSQFTSFLNIIEEYLEKHEFQYLRLDGRMRLDERLKALDDFNEPGSPFTVFLLSMSAGGTGLSLTAASRVFLMDPAWNPAVEEQCFDRCHRMGQTKEVIITKYIVMDTVEERMLTLQKQKRQLMSAAFGAKAQSEEDRIRTRVRDIEHLIGLRPAPQNPNTGPP